MEECTDDERELSCSTGLNGTPPGPSLRIAALAPLKIPPPRYPRAAPRRPILDCQAQSGYSNVCGKPLGNSGDFRLSYSQPAPPALRFRNNTTFQRNPVKGLVDRACKDARQDVIIGARMKATDTQTPSHIPRRHRHKYLDYSIRVRSP